LLDISGNQRKRVYWLSAELSSNPKRVELAQALTQDRTRPYMGLKGNYGLFASSEWWNNINQRVIPLRFVTGTVVRAYEAGQDRIGKNNTVDLLIDDGSTVPVGIYVNNPKDIALFKPGVMVEIVYALDELKQRARDGSVDYSKVALEMTVSVEHNSA